MMNSGFFIRFSAALSVCALLGLAIAMPDAPPRLAGKAGDLVAAIAPQTEPISARACPIGKPPLSTAFASIDEILSVSPLGGVTAPGEVLPAPYMRLNARKGQNLVERRMTAAMAPARADITAIERRLVRDANGAKASSWRIHFGVCETMTLYYDRLTEIAPEILRRAGGLKAFSEIGGPDHIAVKTQIRVQPGAMVGAGRGFDVALHDRAAPAATLARPERYGVNPYARASVVDAPAAILQAISVDQTAARCPLDYLPRDLQAAWADRLGDAYGLRKPKGRDACRTALIDRPGTALGAWYTDSSHNAVTSKVSAVALAPDTIDQQRHIFALHGRVRSLTADLVGLSPMMVEQRESAAKDFLTFEVSRDGAAARVNAPFDAVREGRVYCYNNVRANFVGPRITGVILLQTTTNEAGVQLMKIEARGDALSCIDLAEPWSFSGAETTFYR